MRAIDAEHYLLEVALKRDRVPGFDRYPYSLPAIRQLGTLELHPKVTFIVGKTAAASRRCSKPSQSPGDSIPKAAPAISISRHAPRIRNCIRH
ncbi:MAG: hypothetical protein JNM58_03775 [Xanthomonadaceae bacterium]|nr:hypothetical protein [Xanthomonadaceae bacterium]